jgi:putative oxidoreductase
MEMIEIPGITRNLNLVSWVLKIIVAVILLQTLFFKFTSAEESVYIFTQLGAEPWGRIGSGIVELIAAILLLISRTAMLGAILTLGTISGAILSHIFKLGIVIKDDGGLLFGLALVVFFCSVVILLIHRRTVSVRIP